MKHKPEYESAWDGRASLTDSLERDYAAMRGEGWDLIWEPTSPLTTPWELSCADADRLFKETADQRRQQRGKAVARGMAQDIRNEIALDLFRDDVWRLAHSASCV